eukprot:COSAG01_NODE_5312_length_4341_cov_18.144036_3_plen_278_part_00
MAAASAAGRPLAAPLQRRIQALVHRAAAGGGWCLGCCFGFYPLSSLPLSLSLSFNGQNRRWGGAAIAPLHNLDAPWLHCETLRASGSQEEAREAARQREDAAARAARQLARSKVTGPCAAVGAGRVSVARGACSSVERGEVTVALTSQETTRQLAARRGKSGGRWAGGARGRAGRDGGAQRKPGRSAVGNAPRSTDRNAPTVGEEPPRCAAPYTGAGGDNGTGTIQKRRGISVGSYYDQSHYLHSHPYIDELSLDARVPARISPCSTDNNAPLNGQE